jgi:hypothetical protein
MRWIAMALVLMPAASASAQNGGGIVEGAAGYAVMHDYDGKVTFPRGWFATGAAVVGPFAILGDASGSYKSASDADVHMSVHTLTLMAGPKVAWRLKPVVPYGQMLFGVARTATTYDLPGAHLADAQNYFALAPGAGVDLPFSGRAAIRVGANLRLIRGEQYTPSRSKPFTFRELQFITGVVFR